MRSIEYIQRKISQTLVTRKCKLRFSVYHNEDFLLTICIYDGCGYRKEKFVDYEMSEDFYVQTAKEMLEHALLELL